MGGYLEIKTADSLAQGGFRIETREHIEQFAVPLKAVPDNGKHKDWRGESHEQ
jgi:hypothetical protein